jgi:DNA-binding CsgD family transcriptional regulator
VTPPEPRAGPLTDREAEILGLFAKGFRAAEVAELLGISVHTVTTHVRSLYRKLEVNSRSSAIYEAVTLGLLRLDD